MSTSCSHVSPNLQVFPFPVLAIVCLVFLSLFHSRCAVLNTPSFSCLTPPPACALCCAMLYCAVLFLSRCALICVSTRGCDVWPRLQVFSSAVLAIVCLVIFSSFSLPHAVLIIPPLSLGHTSSAVSLAVCCAALCCFSSFSLPPYRKQGCQLANLSPHAPAAPAHR